MDSGTVVVKGFDELKRQIQKLSSELNKEFENALAKGAEIVKNDAIEKLRPYIYKSMGGRKAIHIEKISGPKSEIKDVAVKVEPDYILYSPRGGTELKWIEFGKPGYAPYPFLRMAFDENKDKVLEVIETELKKVIDKIVK